MDQQKNKAFFKKTFNTVADGYDNPVMRFFPESAQRIANYLKLKGDEQAQAVQLWHLPRNYLMEGLQVLISRQLCLTRQGQSKSRQG